MIPRRSQCHQKNSPLVLGGLPEFLLLLLLDQLFEIRRELGDRSSQNCLSGSLRCSISFMMYLDWLKRYAITPAFAKGNYSRNLGSAYPETCNGRSDRHSLLHDKSPYLNWVNQCFTCVSEYALLPITLVNCPWIGLASRPFKKRNLTLL
jgi:hypothetical protein